MECKQCNKEFTPLKPNQVFCSPACRLKAFRKVETAEVETAETIKIETAETSRNAKEINNLKYLTYLSPEWIEEYISQYTADACNVSLKEARDIKDADLKQNHPPKDNQHFCQACGKPVSDLITLCQRCVSNGATLSNTLSNTI